MAGSLSSSTSPRRRRPPGTAAAWSGVDLAVQPGGRDIFAPSSGGGALSSESPAPHPLARTAWTQRARELRQGNLPVNPRVPDQSFNPRVVAVRRTVPIGASRQVPWQATSKSTGSGGRAGAACVASRGWSIVALMQQRRYHCGHLADAQCCTGLARPRGRRTGVLVHSLFLRSQRDRVHFRCGTGKRTDGEGPLSPMYPTRDWSTTLLNVRGLSRR